ncbi:MAG: hypothetical protein Ct9H300mP23_11290 [Nitrospinota bacterium]|nr:MAG: hypothetical protein Ct9H300mP23_11290 [Nitrospinota bacterium]
MAGLTLKNIHKSFGKVKVIHGIDMEVKDGKFYCHSWTIRMWKIYVIAHDSGVGKCYRWRYLD